jgi:SPP1 gp7 family putative phage head morphogenesis protein
MNSRKCSNLQKRNVNLLTEISKRNFRKIDRVKYFGVNTNIVQYKKLILETFYDEKLIDEAIKEFEKSTEDLHSTLALLNDEMNKRIGEIFSKVSSILYDAFVKGTKRVQKSDGSLIKLANIEDDASIKELVKRQDTYFKNLTKDQSNLIIKTISDSRAKGLSSGETAQIIRSKVKKLSQNRATAISRTEIVRSHNLGQVKVMKDLDIKYYNFITANDSKVCEICKRYQGSLSSPKRYVVELAGNKDNPLPAFSTHPHCRCCVVVPQGLNSQTS